ncbi:MAG: hypothetical protein J0H61_10635 [Alphaproteobacteria bacterium]|jgi:hypothetical protein|nr:hypothetical protein [Alphaproteobacteria bacterium]
MHQRKRVIGIPWFDADSYGPARAAMSDGGDMPASYAHWRTDADALIAEVEEAGHEALKVPIAAKDFIPWCKARNLAPDAKARVRFASQVAFREAGFTGGGTIRSRHR